MKITSEVLLIQKDIFRSSSFKWKLDRRSEHKVAEVLLLATCMNLKAQNFNLHIKMDRSKDGKVSGNPSSHAGF